MTRGDGRGRRPRRAVAAGMRPETLALVQGSFYLATGVWPFLHMRSFLAVTGPKTDLWLVRTVGALVAGVGVGLLNAGRRGYVPADLRRVAALCAAGIVAVEVPTAMRGRISKVYLADAAVEVAFVAAGVLARSEGAVGAGPSGVARRSGRADG